MNVEEVKAELRKEVRALELEKKLGGYALVCCMNDIPEDEMLNALSLRVIKMTDPALAEGPKGWKGSAPGNGDGYEF
jgi:hypothetical protein